MLPFLERAGYAMPPWDFRVPGVTLDLGRPAQVRVRDQGRVGGHAPPEGEPAVPGVPFSDWPGGMYGTQAFQGTKPAAPIAAAWAVLQYLGRGGLRAAGARDDGRDDRT